MTKSNKPERAPIEIANIFLTPPPEIERLAPPLANQVRLYGTLDALVLNLYHVSRNLMLRAADGQPVEGMRLEGSNLHIESPPVARVAIPISTALELVGLIVRQLAQGGPLLQQQWEKLVARITEDLSRASSAAPKEEHAEADK